MAFSTITYADKQVNNGINIFGRWLNDDANEIKRVINHNVVETVNYVTTEIKKVQDFQLIDSDSNGNLII